MTPQRRMSDGSLWNRYGRPLGAVLLTCAVSIGGWAIAVNKSTAVQAEKVDAHDKAITTLYNVKANKEDIGKLDHRLERVEDKVDEIKTLLIEDRRGAAIEARKKRQ